MNLETHPQSEQIKSLMSFVVDRKIDISTQDKFTEAMKQWYINQRQVDNRLSEMPMSNWKKFLSI